MTNEQGLTLEKAAELCSIKSGKVLTNLSWESAVQIWNADRINGWSCEHVDDVVVLTLNSINFTPTEKYELNEEYFWDFENNTPNWRNIFIFLAL